MIIQLIFFIYCIEKTSSNTPRLLIISLDGKRPHTNFVYTYFLFLWKGFRQEYLNTYSLPTINRIQNEGIKTKYGMQPTFVTMTFPNHISIATGKITELILMIYLHLSDI